MDIGPGQLVFTSETTSLIASFSRRKRLARDLLRQNAIFALSLCGAVEPPVRNSQGNLI